LCALFCLLLFSRTVDRAEQTGTLSTEDNLNDDKLLKSSSLSLIRVYGDGRCLFRCAAIHGVKALHSIARSHCSSLPLDKDLQYLEQELSDRIRNEVVEALQAEQVKLQAETSHLHFLLDSNIGKSYNSLAHRLEMMSKPNEYAGFLECLALSYVAGRQVLIYEDKEQHYHLLAKFPASSTQIAEPIRLLYQMDSKKHDGHFDIIIAQGRSSSDYWDVSDDNESSIFESAHHDKRATLITCIIECTSGTPPCPREPERTLLTLDENQNTSYDDDVAKKYVEYGCIVQLLPFIC